MPFEFVVPKTQNTLHSDENLSQTQPSQVTWSEWPIDQIRHWMIPLNTIYSLFAGISLITPYVLVFHLLFWKFFIVIFAFMNVFPSVMSPFVPMWVQSFQFSLFHLCRSTWSIRKAEWYHICILPFTVVNIPDSF